MTPTPSLTAVKKVAPPGLAPIVGDASFDFAALLPGFVAPVMPRQADAEGGKGLPAIVDEDEPAPASAAAAWVTPPLWPAVCPAVNAVKGEQGPVTRCGPLFGAMTLIAPPVPPIAATFVEPLVGDELVNPAVASTLAELSVDDQVSYRTPDRPDANLAPGIHREMLPTRTGSEVAVNSVQGTQTALPNLAARVIHGPQQVLTSPTPLFPGEDRGPVTAGSLPAIGAQLANSPVVFRSARPFGTISVAAGTGLSPAATLSGRGSTPVTSDLVPGSDLRRGAAVVNPSGNAAAPMSAAIAPTSPAFGPLADAPPVADRATGTSAALPQTSDPADATVAKAGKEAPAGTTEPPRSTSIAPVRPTPQAESQPLQTSRIAPAAEMFAAAIQRTVRDERRPAADKQGIALITPTADLATRAVAAPDGSRDGALDIARDTWPTKMIERIEMLRDAVDAVDTSIRLVPDKLGAIDVSLRKEGDNVQVQFTAQQAETRQLLVDAQPKLAELAEAKGVRLSMQTGGGGEGAGSQQQPQPQPQPRASAARSITPQRAAPDDEGVAADERIA